jgi:nicotinate-nucleotide adenylyltransferase
MGKPSRFTGARRIGVFGGTFDPVHYGHLVCAEQLREAARLDVVMFMPCSRQPHKPRRRPSAAADRLAMLCAAVRKYEGFVVSDIETERGGVSYTVDTVRQVRALAGDGPEIWLMLGMDAFLDIPGWKHPDLILSECRFAVATRPGFRRRPVSPRLAAKCCFVEITALDISSTDIRKRAFRGRSIRFLVPDPVEAFIRRKGLYL